jgi:hypothetical protein
MDWVWWHEVGVVTKAQWDAVRANFKSTPADECCHDAGDCSEPLCGRARPAGRAPCQG